MSVNRPGRYRLITYDDAGDPTIYVLELTADEAATLSQYTIDHHGMMSYLADIDWPQYPVTHTLADLPA